MVKTNGWGLCNSDTLYSKQPEGGVRLAPFPKPRVGNMKDGKTTRGRLLEQH